jgi:hypothetical protein
LCRFTKFPAFATRSARRAACLHQKRGKKEATAVPRQKEEIPEKEVFEIESLPGFLPPVFSIFQGLKTGTTLA